MLTRVDVQKFSGSVLSLPLMDISGGYIVKEIDGLDPVNAAITSKSYAQSDGVQIQSTRRDSRSIPIKLGFAPDFVTTTVSNLRARLYQYFTPESVITLSFYIDDVLYAVISGTVETCVHNPFTVEPEMDITVFCPNPDFTAPSVSRSLLTVTDTSTITVVYAGSSETGVVFTLNVNTTLSGFTIYNTRPDGLVQRFDVTASLVTGDVVTISSVTGAKFITRTRAGLTTSILYNVNSPFNWISLLQGNNLIRVHASAAGVPCTLLYTPKYAALPD